MDSWDNIGLRLDELTTFIWNLRWPDGSKWHAIYEQLLEAEKMIRYYMPLRRQK
jgi:hypothetical protein